MLGWSRLLAWKRLEVARRSTTNRIRVFSYDLPESSDENLASAQETTTAELADLFDTLNADHGDDIETVAREMKPCAYREIQHYEEFLDRGLLNHSLIELGETGELDTILSP